MYAGEGIGYPLAPKTNVVTVPTGSEGNRRCGASDGHRQQRCRCAAVIEPRALDAAAALAVSVSA